MHSKKSKTDLTKSGAGIKFAHFFFKKCNNNFEALQSYKNCVLSHRFTLGYVTHNQCRYTHLDCSHWLGNKPFGTLIE